jgi:hypothetical protein
VALNVAPALLYLPRSDSGQPVALTERIAVPWDQAWAWTTGGRSLEAENFTDELSAAEIAEAAVANDGWRLMNQPHVESGRVSSEQFRLLSIYLENLVQPLLDALATGISMHDVVSFARFVMTMHHPARSGSRGRR